MRFCADNILAMGHHRVGYSSNSQRMKNKKKWPAVDRSGLRVPLRRFSMKGILIWAVTLSVISVVLLALVEKRPVVAFLKGWVSTVG